MGLYLRLRILVENKSRCVFPIHMAYITTFSSMSLFCSWVVHLLSCTQIEMRNKNDN